MFRIKNYRTRQKKKILREPEIFKSYTQRERWLKMTVDFRGAWVAQSVERLTLAQVMISWFVGLSPVSSSVLTAQSLELALDSVSPSLSAPPLLTFSLSLSLSQK